MNETTGIIIQYIFKKFSDMLGISSILFPNMQNLLNPSFVSSNSSDQETCGLGKSCPISSTFDSISYDSS